MRPSPLPAALLLLALGLSGCLESNKPSGRAALDYPPEWDTNDPERSFLATEPYYVLDHSSSFLAKGTRYARYIVRVPHTLEDVQLFFSTATQYTKARTPDIQGEAYHFEFMQIRPLGQRIEDTATNANAQFSHSLSQDSFTLTYLYGKGTNYQYLAPYQGDPDHWTFRPGFYEFVIATDEQLTVGINVRTRTDAWSTFFHPQELGEARAEHLDYYLKILSSAGGKTARIDEERKAVLRAEEGEVLNYFAFADLMYLTNTAAIAADGQASVTVDGQETAQRIQLFSPEGQRAEAYAFAVDFNHAGPVQRTLKVRVTFEEPLSVESSLAAILFVFVLAVHPTEALAGLPAASNA